MVRAVRRTPTGDSSVDLLRTGAKVTAYAADVRVSDIAQPLQGDRIDIGDDSFNVKSYELDTEKLVWKLNLVKRG